MRTVSIYAPLEARDAKLSPHLTFEEVFGNSGLPPSLWRREAIAQELLDAFETIRAAWGRPIRINSGARSAAQQQQLAADGYRTAKTSPHVVDWRIDGTNQTIIVLRPCMALDLDTASPRETRELAKLAFALVPGSRVICEPYLLKGQTFVHFDRTPTLCESGQWNVATWPTPWRSPLRA